MRTTLDIDDDVLAAAKDLAAGQKTTAGKIISDLVRKALTQPSSEHATWENGVLVLPMRGSVVTPELVDRLAEDHDNAARLARGLADLPGVSIDPWSAQTNMVFMGIPTEQASDLKARLLADGILIGNGPKLRLVTHLDVSRADIDRALGAIRGYFAGAVATARH